MVISQFGELANSVLQQPLRTASRGVVLCWTCYIEIQSELNNLTVSMGMSPVIESFLDSECSGLRNAKYHIGFTRILHCLHIHLCCNSEF